MADQAKPSTVHPETVTAEHTSSHQVQGPQSAKDPPTAHRNYPVGRAARWAPCGSNATRNATTGVHARP